MIRKNNTYLVLEKTHMESEEKRTYRNSHSRGSLVALQVKDLVLSLQSLGILHIVRVPPPKKKKRRKRNAIQDAYQALQAFHFRIIQLIIAMIFTLSCCIALLENILNTSS